MSEMDLVVEPEVYQPVLDDNKCYVDMVPYNIQVGTVRCLCTKTVFTNRQGMLKHFETQRHKRWLKELNDNKGNLYVENVRLSELVENQKKIIAKLEKDVQTKIMTIDCLTLQLIDKCRTDVIVTNLLD